MPILGTPRTLAKRFAFLIEIDSFAHAGFSSCSELSVEVANVQYWEGGRLVPHKSPGRLTFADVTLERGATRDRDLYRWFGDVVQAAAGIGLPDNLYKRNLDIVQQDRDGTTLRRWSLYGAWPTKFVASGGWDASSDEALVESVTLTYDYFELSA
jgi:phage tail-like protein